MLHLTGQNDGGKINLRFAASIIRKTDRKKNKKKKEGCNEMENEREKLI
jgi:hypothetical protein